MTEGRLFVMFGFCLFFTMDAVLGQTSILDSFVGPLRIIRKSLQPSINVDLTSPYNQNLLKSQNKLQPIFTRFPCSLNNTRSKTSPKSVHMLRPGDIDVIAALGDSLSAGVGVFASSIHQMFFESRGASFISGGDASWKTYLTITNIFKVFNPNMYGYSNKNTFSIDPLSRFNVAELGAISDNMPFMVNVLVKRIRNDRNVKFNTDWKFVNILIGSNDFCSEICYYRSPEKLLSKHEDELMYVLRYLRENLPRTFVNLIPPFNPIYLRKFKRKPNICVYTHSAFCPCLFGVVPDNKMSAYADTLLRWQEMDVRIGNLEEFQRDDFAVVVQPVTINMTLPLKNGIMDYSYTSADCFHLSQKGYAAFANGIWNNILTPVGNKTGLHNFNILDEFSCPSEENPYIFTNKNSIV